MVESIIKAHGVAIATKTTDQLGSIMFNVNLRPDGQAVTHVELHMGDLFPMPALQAVLTDSEKLEFAQRRSALAQLMAAWFIDLIYAAQSRGFKPGGGK